MDDKTLRLSRYNLILILLFAAGLLLRWLQLDARPVHHDESLHLMYGRYFVDWPDFHFYRYDPMLHGPLLYNVLRAVYGTLGSTTWAGRALVAFLGSVLLFSPLLFRRHFKPGTFLALVSAVALSPTLVYWSRFIREDNLQLFGMLLTLAGILVVPAGKKAVVVLLGISLQFCEKENSYVTLALVTGYLVFESLFFAALDLPTLQTRLKGAFVKALPVLGGLILSILILLGFYKFSWGITPGATPWPQFIVDSDVGRTSGVLSLAIARAPAGVFGIVVFSFIALFYLTLVQFFGRLAPESFCAKIADYVRTYRWEVLFGYVVALCVYCYLYSAGFRYADGIIDGVFRKSIGYWLNQHNIERISGPFVFHLYVLSWYESLFVIAAIVQMILFYRSAPMVVQIIGGLTLAGGLILTGTYAHGFTTDLKPWSFFKLKGPWEITALFIIIVHPVVATVVHLLRRERTLAFWGYLFFASVFTYSYLGEKVPWLSLYPFLPGLFYLLLYFEAYFSDPERASRVAGYPVAKLVAWIGTGICLLGLLFGAQEGFWAKGGEFAQEGPYNLTYLGVGALLLAFSLAGGRIKFFGTCNLARVGFVVGSLFVLRASILTNFVFDGKANEYISQVHTTDAFHRYVTDVRRAIESPLSGKPANVLGMEDSVWPITWYMVDVPSFKFNADESERKNFDFIFQNERANTPVPAGFRQLTLPLRGWWVPDFEKMTFKRFLNYAFNHTPWSTPGFSNIQVLVKIANSARAAGASTEAPMSTVP